MTKVDEIKVAIAALPDQELARLRRWFTEHDWAKWDRQVEDDADAGALDFLVDEARDAKQERAPRV